jgi:hypothetical protein
VARQGEGGSAVCPNCGAEVVVPKSTRSFICKACDAIIKAIGSEEGFILKVVGTSVEENPEFQTLEASANDFRKELDELHLVYEAEATKPVGKTPARLALLGVVVTVGGLILLAFVRRKLGIAVTGLGAILFFTGLIVRSIIAGRRRAYLAGMSAEMLRLARERDGLEARAAQIKVQHTA